MNGIGFPTWIKAWVQVGVLPGIILFLLLQMSGVIPSPAKEAAASSAESVRLLKEHNQKTDEIIARIVKGLYVQCQNSAQDKLALNNCENIK